MLNNEVRETLRRGWTSHFVLVRLGLLKNILVLKSSNHNQTDGFLFLISELYSAKNKNCSQFFYNLWVRIKVLNDLIPV